MAINNQVNIKISAIENLSEKLGGIKAMAGKVQSSLSAMGNVAKNIGIAVGGALAGVTTFGVQSAISIEQTRVAFENLYQDSKKASDMMQNLSDFAKKTPFEFAELTDVALKLKNVAGVGDKELIPMLTNLGDISSSQGKSLSQIVEAYNDAITGEYERLKEFGIKASKSGDEVTFSFKGQQKTVKATSEEIGKYLQEVGKMNGIAGAMDKQSMTLGGRLSTLKDQFKGLSMAIVGVSETGDIAKGGIFDKLSTAVGQLGSFLENNQEAIVGGINTIVGAFQFGFDTIMNVINMLVTGGTGDFIGFFDQIKGTVQAGLGFITEFWNKYGADIMLVITTVFNAIRGIIENFFTYIGPVISTSLKVIGDIFSVFGSLLRGDFSGTWDAIASIVRNALVLIKDIAFLGINLVLGVFGTSTKEIAEIFSKTWENIKNKTKSFLSNISSSINGGLSIVADTVSGIFNGLVNSAKEWGGNLIQMFVDGIKQKVQALKDGIIEISTTISDYLGFHSPTKKGPASDSDKWMPNFIKMLSLGLEKGKTEIETKAKNIADKLGLVGTNIKVSDIANSLMTISSKAQESFGSLTSSIQGSVDKIKSMRDELKGINDQIASLYQQKASTEKEGKMALAERSIAIEKEIATLKADAEASATAEGQAKLLKLQEELDFAGKFLTTQEKAQALQKMNLSESQLIMQSMWEKMMALDNEIVKQKDLATAKMQAIKDEEALHKELVQSKISLDNMYFQIFNQRIEGVKSSIRETINMMRQLNSLSGGNTTGLAGARATGGPVVAGSTYKVGENGTEYFTPSKSGYITPANNSNSVNITFGNVTVRSDADIQSIARTIEDSLTRKMQLFQKGIA